ncbi:4770_t:CDS:2 [Ambispora leptoticha]|uniref:4770_t:CDS:1 n=1 Tax=Ambispora leptoticha TaxID=144679 RepID=A0A9N9F1S6_9GLOM|nr:4770_t:CDS:2 [Ambispora leptoticha]
MPANSDSNASDSTIAKQPPRPPNAFILYRQAKQPALIQADKHLTNAQVSRQMAEMWKAEPPQEKLKWERMADRRKLEHMKQYPNYIYKPNKKNKVDKTRKNARQEKAKKSVAAASNKLNGQQSNKNLEPSRTGPIRSNSIKNQLKMYQPIATGTSIFNHPTTPFPLEQYGNYSDPSAALMYTPISSSNNHNNNNHVENNPYPNQLNLLTNINNINNISNIYTIPDVEQASQHYIHEYYLHNGPSTPSTSNSSVTNSPIANHPVAAAPDHYYQPPTDNNISYVALLHNELQFYDSHQTAAGLHYQ